MASENKYLTLLSFGILMLFTTCKKYPENTVWFKNPKKIPVIRGYIIEYKVNGIDSLDLLDLYYKPVYSSSSYPYNKTNRSVKNELFYSCCPGKGFYVITCDLFTKFTCDMGRDKRTLRIESPIDTMYYSKQLFINDKPKIDWQIEYLDRKGNKSKIKADINGNIYEITFKN